MRNAFAAIIVVLVTFGSIPGQEFGARKLVGAAIGDSATMLPTDYTVIKSTKTDTSFALEREKSPTILGFKSVTSGCVVKHGLILAAYFDISVKMVPSFVKKMRTNYPDTETLAEEDDGKYRFAWSLKDCKIILQWTAGDDECRIMIY